MWISLLLTTLRSIAVWVWLLCKPVFGWLFIIVGLIGMPMPVVNGLIFLAIGLALVGPRNRIIRWSRVHLKLLLRRWAALPTPLVGPLGRLALTSYRQVSHQYRRLRRWWANRPGRSITA